MNALDAYRNPNGTYDGVALLSDVSGLSAGEIRWTFERVKALKAEGKSKDEIRNIVHAEAKAGLWKAPA